MNKRAQILSGAERMWVCGHRGAPASGALENTLASFDEAVRAGATLVEFDVRVAGDDTAVVFHDRTLKRIYGDDRALRTLDYEALAKIGISSLEQTLSMLKGRAVPLVEVKEHEAVPGTIAALERLGMAEEALVQSFVPDAVRDLAAAGFYAGLLVEAQSKAGVKPACKDVIEAAKQAGAQFVGLAKELVDAPWMAELHQHGLWVAVWTVNALEEMARMASLGVRVLITDDPSAALRRGDGLG